jgi:hypothetical protein
VADRSAYLQEFRALSTKPEALAFAFRQYSNYDPLIEAYSPLRSPCARTCSIDQALVGLPVREFAIPKEA